MQFSNKNYLQLIFIVKIIHTVVFRIKIMNNTFLLKKNNNIHYFFVIGRTNILMILDSLKRALFK